MEDFLNTWGVPELVPIFKEQKIDFDAFLLLKEEELRTIVPQLGLFLKIRTKLQELQLLQNTEVTLPDIDFHVTEPSTSCSATTVDDNQSNQSCASLNASTSCTNEEITASNHQTHLLAYLNSINDGKEILQAYRLNKELKRRLLVKLIIDRELSGDANRSILKNRFELLSQQIVDIFPTESKFTYYISPRRDAAGKPISAQGKLYDKYSNTRKKYIKLELAENRGKTKKRNYSESIDVPGVLTTPEIDTALNWLHFNVGDWPKIISQWKLTSSVRIQTFKNEDTTIDQYFDLYPALKMPLGHELILIDFITVLPAVNLDIGVKWDILHKSIIRVGSRKKCPIINKIIETHITENEFLTISKNQIEKTAALLVLPLLFPSIVRKKKSKDIHKYSKAELDFVMYVEKEEDLRKVLEEREKRHQIHKTTEQPQIIIIGNVANPKNFVKINEVLYEVECPLKALDICFKSFFVFNASYPASCEQCWVFVQKKIYNIETETDPSFISTNSVYSDILLDQSSTVENAVQPVQSSLQ
ncbi:hypothetical protein PPYR_07763 [Photinus pyralis]|uniref:SAM domain-containing protein n=1 Tax=Photinus pyralis TaxID=7054 RepID=A0A5N4ARI1_PHOPY|nr:hypothetical protein PPYR_07763 [Photinus pyralis]